MNRKTTKILAILALAVQALGVMLAVVVMFLQNRLLPSLMGWTPKDTGIVFPVVLFSMVVQLVIYLIFVSSLQKYTPARSVIIISTFHIRWDLGFSYIFNKFVDQFRVVFFADLALDNLTGDLHCHASDLALQFVDGLAALLGNVGFSL